MSPIKNILIHAAANLSYIAYIDEDPNRNQKQDITAELKAIPLTSNGPYELLWGPATTAGLLSYIAKGADNSYALTFRGTVDESNTTAWLDDWIDNLYAFKQVPWKYPVSAGAKISAGMSEAFANITASTDPETNATILDYLTNQTEIAEIDIITTGHSLGGAAANLAAVWLTNALTKPVVPYTFAAPTVTDPAFYKLYGTLVPESYHCVNSIDLVPMAWSRLWMSLSLYFPAPLLLTYGKGLVAAGIILIYYEVRGLYQTVPGKLDNIHGPATNRSNDFPTEVMAQHSMGNVYLPNCGAGLGNLAKHRVSIEYPLREDLKL